MDPASSSIKDKIMKLPIIVKILVPLFFLIVISAIVYTTFLKKPKTADAPGSDYTTGSTDATDNTDTTGSTDATGSADDTDATGSTDDTDTTGAADATDSTDSTDSTDATDPTGVTETSSAGGSDLDTPPEFKCTLVYTDACADAYGQIKGKEYNATSTEDRRNKSDSGYTDKEWCEVKRKIDFKNYCMAKDLTAEESDNTLTYDPTGLQN